MLNVSEEVKTLYESSNVPSVLNLRIDNTLYTDSNIVAGSVSITESLCSLETFNLSTVEKNELVFSLFNEEQQISNLIGKTVVASHIITLNNNETETVPLGTYTIVDAVKDGDYIITCTCYDGMLAFDKVIDTWWNDTLEFPITIKNLVESLFEEINVQYTLPQEFTNANFEITARPTFFENIKASEVLGYIQEITGGFFKVNRFGVIKFLSAKQINADGLYPQIGLYPKTGVYPVSSNTIGFGDNSELNRYSYRQIFGDLIVADYAVNKITMIQVKGGETDTGITVGTGTDVFIIEGNPLLYNITEDNRNVIENILTAIKEITYVPFTGEFTALPYLEVGDCVYAVTYEGQKVKSPILYRVLNSQKLSVDSFTTKGTKQRQTTRTINRSISTINQRTHEIINSVDQMSSTISNVQNQVTVNTTNITQTANAVTLSASRSGIFNLLTNSDFSNQTDRISGWTTYSIENTTYQIDNTWSGAPLDYNNIEDGHYLHLTTTANSDQASFYQIINYNGVLNERLQGQITYKLYNADNVDAKLYLRIHDEDTQLFYGYVTTTLTSTDRACYRWRLSDSVFSRLKDKHLTTIEYGIFITKPTQTVEIGVNHFLLVFGETLLPWFSWTNYASKDLISQINVAPSGVKIQGEKVDIYGVTTFHNTDGTGGTTIDGATIQAATIKGNNSSLDFLITENDVDYTISMKPAVGTAGGGYTNLKGIQITGGDSSIIDLSATTVSVEGDVIRLYANRSSGVINGYVLAVTTSSISMQHWTNGANVKIPLQVTSDGITRLDFSSNATIAIDGSGYTGSWAWLSVSYSGSNYMVLGYRY